MTEYWLLKKTLGNWTKVSWWSEEEKDKATKSYASMVDHNSGYAWRLVKMELVAEKLLDEMMDEPKFSELVINFKEADVEPLKSAWGNATGWSKLSDSDNTHGMVGKVWLGNPTTKEKKRVAPDEVATMMAAGWIKAGPRTVL